MLRENTDCPDEVWQRTAPVFLEELLPLYSIRIATESNWASPEVRQQVWGYGYQINNEVPLGNGRSFAGG
jgi:hypothetical protein